MSNPIADTAEYFALWKQVNHRDQADEPTLPDANTHFANDNTTAREDVNFSEARSQWLRVLNRISFLNPLDTSTTPPPPSATNHLLNDQFSDDDESIIDRDTFELMRSAARDHRHRLSTRHVSLNVSTSATGAVRGRDVDNEDDPSAIPIGNATEEEEKLPSAYDLENDQIYPLSDASNVQEESNYFTHPFRQEDLQEQQHDELLLPQAPAPTQTPSNKTSRRHTESTSTPGTVSGGDFDEDGRILKDKWDRTLDKLKLIANLQLSSNTSAPTVTPTPYSSGPSHTLATYYPPAFDPIFAAFAKDEHGRNLVIIRRNLYV
jgi:hypothetical protein